MEVSDMDSFCIYCQIQFSTLAKLKRHLILIHPGTYAAISIAGEKSSDEE